MENSDFLQWKDDKNFLLVWPTPCLSTLLWVVVAIPWAAGVCSWGRTTLEHDQRRRPVSNTPHPHGRLGFVHEGGQLRNMIKGGILHPTQDAAFDHVPELSSLMNKPQRPMLTVYINFALFVIYACHNYYYYIYI